ncbi:MAG: response regulator [Chloroflexota bacterium]
MQDNTWSYRICVSPSDTQKSYVRQQHILVVGDELHTRCLLELILHKTGFKVSCVLDGQDLVQVAQARLPDLIIVDLMISHMAVYELIRQMRNDARTAHIPVLILTSRTHYHDIIVGLENGADDFISKPFVMDELIARIRSHLRRLARQVTVNPLSGLLGGTFLINELQQRLDNQQTLALLHIDIDNFKVFNDVYGFSRGDRAIFMLAKIIQQIVQEYGQKEDFIGHIGGDDFALLTVPDCVDTICSAIISRFDQVVPTLYDDEDWQRGYLTGVDRFSVVRRFNLLSVSIGVSTTKHRSFECNEEMTRIAAEMKLFAKSQGGRQYAVDQRTTSIPYEPDRRRGGAYKVLLASADLTFCAALQPLLLNEHHTMLEAHSIEHVFEYMQCADKPDILILDYQLSPVLWDLPTCSTDILFMVPTIVCVHDDNEIVKVQATGLTTYLQQPFPLSAITAYIEHLLQEDVGYQHSRSVGL